MQFIFSFEYITVIKPDPNIFFCIAASVGDVVAVNPNGIKTILAVLSTFSLKANHFLVMVLKVYMKILLILLFYATEFMIILY